jgi:large subunit ribosomal protein L31e
MSAENVVEPKAAQEPQTKEASTTPSTLQTSEAKAQSTVEQTKESKPLPEEEIVLERNYTIRIRQRIVEMGIPRTKRKNRAIKYIRQFVKRHLKVEDDSMIKLDPKISEKIFSLGKGKLPSKISFKVKKLKSGIVKVELLE